MNALIAPVESTDAELDAVAAGLNDQHGVGLIVANIGVDRSFNGFKISALNNNQVTLTNVLSGNDVTVPIGVAVAVLSGATGVLQHL